MNRLTARVAGESADIYNEIIKMLAAKRHDRKKTEIKVAGLTFKFASKWSDWLTATYAAPQLKAEYKFVLLRGDEGSDALELRCRTVDYEHEVSSNDGLMSEIKSLINIVNASNAYVAKLVSKRVSVNIGDIAIPVRPAKEGRFEYMFYHSGVFKFSAYGSKNLIERVELLARRSDTTKRVSVNIVTPLRLNKLQSAVDAALAKNPGLILERGEQNITRGTVKIGDETIEISVSSMKRFTRHIENLRQMYEAKH